ncbi:AAA family ATPase, partial [Pseudobutyrivibrio sp.]|uniref:AAA family ATPase n=1 Tax=Pseudobutyrivibrio sp. TaxID=2014367 RepID=UPI00386566F4
MLKDIYSIEILSPYFANPTKLELFKTNKRASIIFGRNGSGKSTIAKAFKYIKEGDTSIKSAKIYGGNNKEISLSDTEKNQLWIFDEDYILQNIKLKEFGLDTIVMLGNSVELSDKIDEAQKRQNDEKDKYDLALTNHEAMYNDPQSVNSPEYYLNKMVSALKGDGNWADRDKKIKNTKINTPV